MAEYRFLNVNPTGEKEEDCVCRAITLVSGLPYYEVYDKLYLVADLLDCEMLCVYCYRFLIENVLNYAPIPTDDLYPAEFADKYPDGTYLLRMEGHIVPLIDGVIYDLFDSRYYGIITDAWRVD